MSWVQSLLIAAAEANSTASWSAKSVFDGVALVLKIALPSHIKSLVRPTSFLFMQTARWFGPFADWEMSLKCCFVGHYAIHGFVLGLSGSRSLIRLGLN